MWFTFSIVINILYYIIINILYYIGLFILILIYVYGQTKFNNTFSNELRLTIKSYYLYIILRSQI